MNDRTERPDEDLDRLWRRREALKGEIDALDRHDVADEPGRRRFFNSVYDHAQGDAARVPWADLRPKPHLLKWLQANPGRHRTALDIACGLGDNAEALSAAGYDTTAFDLSRRAIDWASQRFADSAVKYRVADLFDPHESWRGGFDLVHECYTLQALPPQMRDRAARAVATLVAPSGRLLVYTRWQPDGTAAQGPPWPLQERCLYLFAGHGLTLVEEQRFEIVKRDRRIPHAFALWTKGA